MSDHEKPTSAEHAEGSVKEAIGKLIGDARIEAEGKAQKRRARMTGTSRDARAHTTRNIETERRTTWSTPTGSRVP